MRSVHFRNFHGYSDRGAKKWVGIHHPHSYLGYRSGRLVRIRKPLNGIYNSGNLHLKLVFTPYINIAIYFL
jgi:hypothetical protein